MQIYVDDEDPVWMDGVDEDLIDDDQPEMTMAHNSEGYPVEIHLSSFQRTVQELAGNANVESIKHHTRATKKSVESPFYGSEPFKYRNTHADSEGLLSNERTSFLTSHEDRVLGLIGHKKPED